MPITRTEAELKSAIETMFRVRAVESPPDDQGARTIWHRGTKGADLVTWVDAFGRVTRQELYLFDDCLIWEKASGVRTGAAEVREGAAIAPSPASIAFDAGADDTRLGRARQALRFYAGPDKFILHAQQLVGVGGRAVGAPVTREVNAAEVEQRITERAPATAAARPGRWPITAMIVGGGLILAAIVWWLTRA